MRGYASAALRAFGLLLRRFWLAFLILLGAFGSVLADELSERKYSRALAERGVDLSGLRTWWTVGALGALFLLAWLGVALWNWSWWRKQFAVAGSARRIDASKLGSRRLDEPFVSAPRILRRPLALQARGENPVIAPDAAAYLRDRLPPAPPGFGVLLRGRPTLGKTRFLVEWLRATHPRCFVLAPKKEDPFPDSHPLLRRSGGVCLFLDDLEGYVASVPKAAAFVRELQDWGVPVFVLATVRSGGPANTVESGDTVRVLALDVVELDAPSDEMLEAAEAKAREAGVQDLRDLRPRRDRDHTFEFLLGREFEEQRKVYNRMATSPASEHETQACRLL